MLLKAGAKLDLRSTDGLTAYEVAVKEKCDKIAQVKQRYATRVFSVVGLNRSWSVCCFVVT
jgi:hypothetical protein